MKTCVRPGLIASVVVLAVCMFSGEAQGESNSWCIVDGVVEGSRAEAIGFKPDDIIERINGITIGDRETLESGIERARGGEIQADVLRGGNAKRLTGRFEGEVLGILPQYLLRPRILSPAEMREDLDTLIGGILEIHPNPYVILPEETWNRLVEETRGVLEDSLWTREFWEMAAELVAELGDGRTQLRPPGGEWRHRLATGKEVVFPLLLHVAEEVFVAEDFSDGEIRRGDRLVAINEVPVGEIIDRLSRCTSGTLTHFRRRSLEESFPQMIFEVYGWGGPFDLDLARDEETRRYSLGALSLSAYLERRSAGVAFEAVSLPSLRSTVLRIDRLEDMVAFEEFLLDVFTELLKRGDEYLVVDVRRTTGGNAAMAGDLLSYVASKPYRLTGEKRVRVSRYNQMWFPARRGMGDALRAVETELREPGEMPLRFEGKVLVLVSNLTSGAAGQFAAAVKDLKLGTLIGEETGDPASCWADPYAVTLPNSGLTLEVSSTYVTRPSGSGVFTTDGVTPDVRVTLTREALKEGIDPWMEKVEELITADGAEGE